ncbi:hypothetical protein PPH41_22550, partial [Burkholderia gladioli]|nr:hypothetical protein [Burkholderia gladioli]
MRKFLMSLLMAGSLAATGIGAAMADDASSARLLNRFCMSGSLETVPFVFVVSRFRLATSCFWFTESLIVIVPALTPLFV